MITKSTNTSPLPIPLLSNEQLESIRQFMIDEKIKNNRLSSRLNKLYPKKIEYAKLTPNPINKFELPEFKLENVGDIGDYYESETGISKQGILGQYLYGDKPQLQQKKQYSSVLPSIYQSQKKDEVQSPFVKALSTYGGTLATALGHYIANKHYIDAAEKAAMNMGTLRMNPGQVPVAPITDLPSELVAKSEADRSGIVARKTSDQTLNALNEQMANAMRAKMAAEFGAQRTQYILGQIPERNKMLAMNAQAMANAMNEEAKYSADIANKKAMISAEAEGERRNMLNKIASETFQALAQNKEMSEYKKMAADQDKYNKLLNQYNMLMHYKQNNLGDPQFDDKIKTIMESIQGYSGVESAKHGTKLIPRNKQ